MNIIVKAVQDAMYVIPEEILQQTFLKGHNNYRAPIESLENRIITDVIKARVVPDANIAKGEHMTIPINNLHLKQAEDYRYIYEIPTQRLLGKTILSVLSVAYSPMNGAAGAYGYAYTGIGPMYSNDVLTAGQQAVDASASVPTVGTARAELIGENMVLIEDPQRFTNAYYLQCYVTDDNYLNKIDPRSYEYFSTLCEYAIKAHVYRKLRIRMDRGQVEFGSVIGTFKEIVDEYADAETNYRTFLRETWAAVAFMDNRDRYRRYLKAQIPIGL